MTKPEVQHCHNMQDVRRHIDAIDAQIVPLLAERAGYVAQAARIKDHADQIVDEARIEYIVARVRDMAAQHGLKADIAERTWRAMMAAYIDFEREQFKLLRNS